MKSSLINANNKFLLHVSMLSCYCLLFVSSSSINVPQQQYKHPLLVGEEEGSSSSVLSSSSEPSDPLVGRQQDQPERMLQATGILDQYEVGVNRVDFQTTIITVYYPLSDLVPNGTVSVNTYSDNECTVLINDNDYLMPEVIWDSVAGEPDGTKNREVAIHYTVEPSKIQESDVWTQDEDDQFFMEFCVGFNLFTDQVGAPGSVLISGYDTIVKLQVDLLGDFGLEVNVNPTDKLAEEADQIYYAEGFLCDENNVRTVAGTPLIQGQAVRVCVVPRADALADGIYMRQINSFYFQRINGITGELLSQDAVTDAQPANDLTSLVCVRGSELCHFETLLNANFYYRPGIVEGFGEAWLQFGSGSIRRLRIEMGGNNNSIAKGGRNRALQVDGGFAGSAYFDANFFVIPPIETFSFEAIAYECDQFNRALNESEPKLLGEGIRVCITPDEVAQDFDVRIHQIESWNFTKDFVIEQNTVLDGFAAEDGLTLLHCPPGSPICSFKTQFLPDFFGTSGDVIGFGMVILEFSKGGLTERRLVSIPSLSSPSSSDRRYLQEEGGAEEGLATLEDLNIAGSSLVSVNTSVLYRPEDIPEECLYEHQVTEWWVQQSMEDRYMYIGMVVGALAAIACALCGCYCCPCLSERKEEDEEVKKGGGVEVNVDLKKDENKNLISSSEKRTEEHTKKESSRKDNKRGSSRTLALSDKSDDKMLEPGKLDVIFGGKRHPGTRQFIRKVKNVVQKDTDEEYGPSMYRKIMRKNDGINFFVVNKRGKYSVPKKNELRDCIGQIVKETRRNLSEHGGGISRSSSRRSLDSDSDDGRRKKKSSRRDSTSKSRSNVTETTETTEVITSKRGRKKR